MFSGCKAGVVLTKGKTVDAKIRWEKQTVGRFTTGTTETSHLVEGENAANPREYGVRDFWPPR